MKKFPSPTIAKMVIAFLLTCPAFAHGTPLSFDCDVPPDRYSSVTQDVNGPMMISGTVEPVEMRSGDNLPVAGARLDSVDGQSRTGFQLVAPSARAKQFHIVLRV